MRGTLSTHPFKCSELKLNSFMLVYVNHVQIKHTPRFVLVVCCIYMLRVFFVDKVNLRTCII